VPFISSMAIGLTDEQWAQLVKLSGLPLPPEARADFEGCVGFYCFARDRQPAYRRAIGTSDDRKRWRRKILDLLKDLEETALKHPHAKPYWIADLKDFAEELTPGRRELPTGPQTQAAYKLVELAGFFYEKHTHEPVTRSYKKSRFGAFIKELCAIADPHITSGTIDEALKKISRKRRGGNHR
jgi:hypothetical protein